MASDRGMVSGGLTRRALVFAAPSLLVSTVVLAEVARLRAANGKIRKSSRPNLTSAYTPASDILGEAGNVSS